MSTNIIQLELIIYLTYNNQIIKYICNVHKCYKVLIDNIF